MITTDESPSPPNAAELLRREALLPYCASPFSYARRKTHVVMVGDVGVGGDNPIRVQSMTTTRTLDTDATVAQAERLVQAGCEIVRITAPTPKDARNLAEIKARLRAKGITVPLVADIHFSPDAALEAAEHVEKVRINPGNYADGRKFAVRSYTSGEYAGELERIEERFAPLVLKCKARKISMRIGTNHGSLSDRIVNQFGDTPEGMVESALEFLRICEKYDYFDVILSMKASNPKVMIAAYRLLAARMGELGMTYPFHLGVTEAGNGIDGRIKSTIGIGSLLADGIGDTIRVSLTEEPEEEVPVAFLLANHFTPRDMAGSTTLAPTQPTPVLPQSADAVPWDPFHYSRRSSRSTMVGPITLGGDQPIAVVTRAGSEPAARVLRWASPGARRLRRPDIVEWPIASNEAVVALQELNRRLALARALPLLANDLGHPLPKLGFLASGADPALLESALSACDAVLLTEVSEAATERLARSTAASGKPLWLEVLVANDGETSAAIAQLLAASDVSRKAGQTDVVLGISASTPEALILAGRRLATELARAGDDSPIFLRSQPSPDRLLPSALPLGSLLCDGIGDVIQAGAPEAGQVETELTLDVLQGAGTRLSKTDYVACPSCGRTLFDLQSTTERIKTQTSHLVGVKIAIMGCVVNGPGEMADADFGYVGGTPGHVNLYVGKTCVERAVPAEIADAKLIELIKARGRWHEPEPEEVEAG